MIRTIRFAVIVLLAIQVLTACAVFTPKLEASASPEPNAAYVYGRFFYPGFWPGRGLPRISLAISKEGHDEPLYGVEFDEKKLPALIAIKPGSYVLKIFQGAGFFAIKAVDIAFPEGTVSKFEAQAGKAYYVGDYVGETSSIGVNTIWRVTSITDNYENTTVAFRRKFANFESIETVRAIHFK